jgi:hypothetical protein
MLRLIWSIICAFLNFQRNMKTRRTKKKVKNVTFQDHSELTKITRPTEEPESFSCPFCSRQYIRRNFFEKHVAGCKNDMEIESPESPKRNLEASSTRKPLRGITVLLFLTLIVLAGIYYLFDVVLLFLTNVSRDKMLESESDLFCALNP